MLHRLVIKIFVCMSFNDAPAQVFSCKVLLINVYSRDGNQQKKTCLGVVFLFNVESFFFVNLS